jgi:hypothetical protein
MSISTDRSLCLFGCIQANELNSNLIRFEGLGSLFRAFDNEVGSTHFNTFSQSVSVLESVLPASLSLSFECSAQTTLHLSQRVMFRAGYAARVPHSDRAAYERTKHWIYDVVDFDPEVPLRFQVNNPKLPSAPARECE